MSGTIEIVNGTPVDLLNIERVAFTFMPPETGKKGALIKITLKDGAIPPIPFESCSEARIFRDQLERKIAQARRIHKRNNPDPDDDPPKPKPPGAAKKSSSAALTMINTSKGRKIKG